MTNTLRTIPFNSGIVTIVVHYYFDFNDLFSSQQKIITGILCSLNVENNITVQKQYAVIKKKSMKK